MARIKIQDYIKDVELNRQRLVNATNSDNNSSLSSVVTSAIDRLNESGSSSSNEDLCEIRWFDGDGTLLKTEYIPVGGSVTPPENPNLCSEHLEFIRWYSVIGNTFDNIQHDVDYGAKYTIKNGRTVLDCNFTTYTGKVVPELKFYLTSSNTPYILDWGDGVIETYNISSTSTYSFSHTYSSYGHYYISIYNESFANTSTSIKLKSLLNLSASSHTVENTAIQGIITPIPGVEVIGGDWAASAVNYVHYKYIICNEINYDYLSELGYRVEFFIYPKLQANVGGSINLIRGSNIKVLIIDKSWNWPTGCSGNIADLGQLEKLMIPTWPGGVKPSYDYAFKVDYGSSSNYTPYRGEGLIIELQIMHNIV